MRPWRSRVVRDAGRPRLRIGHVERDGRCVGGELGGEAGRRIRLHVGDHDGRSSSRQQAGRGGADPGRAARHDRHSSVEAVARR